MEQIQEKIFLRLRLINSCKDPKITKHLIFDLYAKQHQLNKAMNQGAL